MAGSDTKNVKKMLIKSIVAGSIYGGLAIIFGMLAQTNILLLDGIYTLISATMSLITLYVAKYIEKQDFDNFPFGKEPMAPLIVFVQYSIILLISIYGIIGTIDTLLNSQTTASLGTALYFSIFGTIYCLVVWLLFKRKKDPHPFYDLELKQWRFGFLFSLGIMFAFIVSELLNQSGYSSIAGYIDPFVSLGITILFIITAFFELKNAIFELTSATPKIELRKALLYEIDERMKHEEIDSYVLRVAKIGSQLVVEIDIIIQADVFLDTVVHQDKFREELLAIVEKVSENTNIWLNVNFTGNLKWSIPEEL